MAASRLAFFLSLHSVVPLSVGKETASLSLRLLSELPVLGEAECHRPPSNQRKRERVLPIFWKKGLPRKGLSEDQRSC